MQQKVFTKITPRILEHIIHKWSPIVQRDSKKWTKTDSKIHLMLTIAAKDLHHEQYLKNKK